MRRLKQAFGITVCFVLAGVVIGGCTKTPQVAAAAKLTYSPPLLPIQIAYDFISKSLSVSLNGEIQTPIGTFGVSTEATVSQAQQQGIRLLIVHCADRRFVYELKHGQRYHIALPTDVNGKTEVDYTGTDDNIDIVIPTPTSETVASLRAQLEQEKYARQQSEAEAEAERTAASEAAAKRNESGDDEDKSVDVDSDANSDADQDTDEAADADDHDSESKADESSDPDETAPASSPHCDCSPCECAECKCAECPSSTTTKF